MTQATPTPRKGLRFYHRRVLDSIKFDGKSPQLFVVTKIAQGTIYYRPVYALGEHETLGTPGCCPVEQWPRWCLCAADAIADCAVEAARKVMAA